MPTTSLTVILVAVGLGGGGASADPPSELVLSAEAQRVEVINRVAPSVVCVFDSNRRGGGSGVLIDPEGHGLTNYHVVAGLLNTRRGFGGLGDGVLYELEVLGIDPTGDLAMFRLLPPNRTGLGTAHQEDAASHPPEADVGAGAGPYRDREGAEGLGESERSLPFRFPYAGLGDSDVVQVGDTAIAMGNPFSLSEDYAPSVSLGIVTGIHRYQWGTQGNLVYTDCIQVDAPINPGSSGGPLFNAAGEIVGINGRISVNTRGRFNVGFGYAVSSNQIKRFLPTLRAGLLARHGTWEATVENVETSKRQNVKTSKRQNVETSKHRNDVVFSEVRHAGPAYDAGIRVGDKLLSFDGVQIQSANQVASMLGTYPAGWPLLLEIEHEDTAREVIVELQPIEPKLARPFVVDRNVNLRQVRRVLRAFRQTVLGDEAAEPPNHWKWTVLRHHTLAADGPTDPAGATAGARIPSHTATPPERFDVSLVGDGPVRMQQRYEDGLAGRLIEYNDKTATQRTTAGGESYELTADAEMILGAMYTMQRWLLSPVDEVDLTALERVAHAGGGALLRAPIEPLGATPQPRLEARANARTTREVRRVCRPDLQLLEFVEWPVAAHAVATFSFDCESFALVRVTVRDLVSRAQATIRLSNHADIGGLVWPCTMEVEGDGYAYRDTLSDWELSR